MNLGARNRTGKRRLGDYGKAPGGINQAEWSDGFAAELIDRFGTLPLGVENLLEIIAIKRSCRDAGIEKLEAGPKGAVVSLRETRFANPAGLVELIPTSRRHLEAPPRPEHRLCARLARRQDPPDGRRQARPGQNRPRRPVRRGALPQPTPGLVMPRAARTA